MEHVRVEEEKIVRDATAPAVVAEETLPKPAELPKKKSSLAMRVKRDKIAEFRPEETAAPSPAVTESAAEPSTPKEANSAVPQSPLEKSSYYSSSGDPSTIQKAQHYLNSIMQSQAYYAAQQAQYGHVFPIQESAAASAYFTNPYSQYNRDPSMQEFYSNIREKLYPKAVQTPEYPVQEDPEFSQQQSTQGSVGQAYAQQPYASGYTPPAFPQQPYAQGFIPQAYAPQQRQNTQNYNQRPPRSGKPRPEGRYPPTGNATYQRTPKGEFDHPPRTDFTGKSEQRHKKGVENPNNFPDLPSEGQEAASAKPAQSPVAESPPMSVWDQPESFPEKPKAVETPKPKPAQPSKRPAEARDLEFQKKQPSQAPPAPAPQQPSSRPESAHNPHQSAYRPRVTKPEKKEETPPQPVAAESPSAVAQVPPKKPEPPAPQHEVRPQPAAEAPLPKAPVPTSSPPPVAPKPAPQPSAAPLSSKAAYEEIVKYLKTYTPPEAALRELKREFYTGHDPRQQRGSNPQLSARGSGLSAPAPSVSERPLIGRLKLTEEEQRKRKEIKESADSWLADKKEDSEEEKMYRNIKQNLNKLSPDNFELITQEILSQCDTEEKTRVIINYVVTKAWNEPVYTRWYTELLRRMMERRMDWDFTPKRVAVKTVVLSLVEDKYTEGFEAYHDRVAQLNADASLTPEDKQEKMNKMRKVLLGNINFMSELLQAKIITMRVIKWAVFYGLNKFLVEHGRAEETGGKISLKEDYLEALLKLFETCGQVVERKENAARAKFEKQLAQQHITGGFTTSDDFVLERLGQMLTSPPAAHAKLLADIEAKMSGVQSIIKVFFSFVTMLKKTHNKPLSMRMESLIDNLFEFRNSNWKTRVTRIEAARRSKKGEAEVRRNAAEQLPAAAGRVEHWEEVARPVPVAPKALREQLRAAVDALNRSARKGMDADTYRASYEQIFLDANDPFVAFQVWLETLGADVRDPATLEPRYELGLRFVQEGLVTSEELYDALYRAYPHFTLIYCDQTHLLGALAELLYRLRRADLVDLQQLRLTSTHKELDDPLELEEYGYFAQQLLAKLAEVFESKPDGRLYAAEVAEARRAGES